MNNAIVLDIIYIYIYYEIFLLEKCGVGDIGEKWRKYGRKLYSYSCNGNGWWILMFHGCRNPNLAKCVGEAQHLEKLGIWSPPGLPNVQSSTAGLKTPRIGVFLVSLERSWSVDIENALPLGIWTSVAQVMGKRRAGSQIGSLTPDH